MLVRSLFESFETLMPVDGLGSRTSETLLSILEPEELIDFHIAGLTVPLVQARPSTSTCVVNISSQI